MFRALLTGTNGLLFSLEGVAAGFSLRYLDGRRLGETQPKGCGYNIDQLHFARVHEWVMSFLIHSVRHEHLDN